MIGQLPTFGPTDASQILWGRANAFPVLLGQRPNLYGGGSATSVPDTGVTFTDNTTGNVSTTEHGFAPKLDGDSSHFLAGDGSWATPSGTGATSAQLLDATRRARYKPFTTGSDAFEFTGSDLGNFTAVNSGSHTVVVTEDNDMLSLNHPGNDASAELHAWVKSATINANDFVEAWVGYIGKPNAAISVGVLMSDGNTYNGSNTQVFYDFFNTISTGLANHTKFNTAGTSTAINLAVQFPQGLGVRLQYLGSNNWAGFVSADGINWLNITGTLSRTMTPSYYGFFCSTWGSANPAIFQVWYCRKGS